MFSSLSVVCSPLEENLLNNKNTVSCRTSLTTSTHLTLQPSSVPPVHDSFTTQEKSIYQTMGGHADIDTYKLNKIFTAPVGDLSAEQQELLNEVKATRTTPRDARFPTQNQANHCWNRYNEWLVCLKSTQDEEGCKAMRNMAVKICPTIWTDKWDEERGEGIYPGIKTD